jgi:type 1 glutamine amidotransferase
MRPGIAARSIFGTAALTMLAFAPAVAQTPGAQALFDGRTLEGWRQVGAGTFTAAADGTITAEGGPGVLYNTRPVRDFVLELEYRAENGGESGVFLRLPEPPVDHAQASRRAYEVQIQDSPPTVRYGQNQQPEFTRLSGGITGFAVPWRNVASAGEWNRYRIEVTGQRYQVYLNGEKVTDFIGNRAREGMIGLESGGTGRVHFRNVRLTTVDGSSAPERLAEVPALQGPAGAAPIRVLVITTTHGFRHAPSIDASREVLRGIEWASEFIFDWTESMAQLNPQNLARYDVVFLNNATLRAAPANPADTAAVRLHRIANVANPMTLEQQAALADFVRGGKGLVSVHSGVDANYGWDEYREMIGGGKFASHPWDRPGRFIVEDPANPAVSHFGDSFWMREEMYVLDVNPRANARVLLSLDMATMDEPAGSQDHPMAYIRRHGEGRVFVTLLGHHAENWYRADFNRHVMQGLRIAAGRLQADFTPQPRQTAR